MVPRKLVLSSSTLLATALVLTMLYSLARVLSASEADDTTAESSTPNTASVGAQALALIPTAAPATEPVSPTEVPAADTAISATRTDGQPVVAPVSGVSASASPSPTAAAPSTAQAGAPQPSPAPVTSAPPADTLAEAQPTTTPPTPRPTTAPSTNQQTTQARPAPTATTQPRLTASSQGVETVRFVKEVNDSVFIIYRGDQLWMVEHDGSCADLTVAIGGAVLIYSPGGFPASNARIVLPNRPRDCAITDATQI